MRPRSAFVLLLVLCVSPAIHGCKSKPTHLTVLYINDLHGHLEPFREHGRDGPSVGGMARIATLVKEVRDEVETAGDHVMLLCAGDILQGTPMSLVFKGEPEIRTMNLMRFDAMVIGNHEFDYGQENLRRLMDLASFPMLSANILTTSADKPPVVDYVVNTYDNIDVAVFGLTTDETPISTHPDNVKGLEFLQPAEIADKLVPVLRGKVDLIIALTHLGFEVDERLAEEVPGIDLIIGGHSHTKVDSTIHVGQTLICQAFEYGICLGRADLTLDRGRVIESRSRLMRVDHTVEEDPVISDLIKEYADRLGEEMEKPVGFAALWLDGERTSIRNRETNLGNLVADAMKELSGADVALVNGGGIRASIDKGEITIKEILTALPFGGELVTLNLTGRQLAEVLKRAATRAPGSGAFLQVSGISFTIKGGEALDIQVSGERLDEKRSYSVATNDFLAAGGDGYSTFKKGTEYYNTGLGISDVLIDYVKARDKVGEEVESRIVKK
jgi:5'-nucleotidase/UDP-sugar diphosphatase